MVARWNDAVAKVGEDVRVKGPMPCAISRIAGYFRNQIVMTSPRAESLQKVIACGLATSAGSVALHRSTSIRTSSFIAETDRYRQQQNARR